MAEPVLHAGTRQPGAPDDGAAELPGQVVSLRHPWRWVAVAVVVVIGVVLVTSLIRNPNFQWDVVFHYFVSGSILAGLRNTVLLTVAAMLVGLLLGIVLAVARDSKNPIVSYAALLYIGLFRGTPLLVQLIFWFNLSSLYPTLGLGIPFGPTFVSGSANALITPVVAAILGLGLNEAAYMAEIVRAGLQSVDAGQTQAAQALGMTNRQVFRRIVLPQAMRVIIPPTGNQTISMLKTTSLVSVIALPELLYASQIIYSRTYQVVPLLITASLWYLLLTTVLTVGQTFLERRLRRGDAAHGGRGRRERTAAADARAAVQDGLPDGAPVAGGEHR
ncbi:amino acid ABC transporter permease [Nakamurella endophytica]|uniref:Polar amino acid ABC transporter permease n=1 Tax=Nakamurella endophytica TaxID=1748367 RepID=A0A917SXZ0_9ACTN|nr:amino acid ABC transporter permease [Nakamurella endophytica]GGM00350.1 polar amino acid ABC transporter permease [Nakamurella endophytica]